MSYQYNGKIKDILNLNVNTIPLQFNGIIRTLNKHTELQHVSLLKMLNTISSVHIWVSERFIIWIQVFRH